MRRMSKATKASALDTGMPLFKHQQESIKRLQKNWLLFDMSDPGTGKTRVQIEAFAARRRKFGGRALVVAPKSLLDAAWKEDFHKFAPDISVVCAYASNRDEALASKADVIVTNHDAVKALVKLKPAFWKDYDTLIVDECFPANTLIDTPLGPIPIEMLECGDLVYNSSGVQQVSNIFRHETIDPLIELELDDGTKITCTEKHPFATTEGWVEAWRTRNMSLVRLDIHKLDQQGTDLLQPQLQCQSDVDRQNTRATQNNWEQRWSKTTRQTQLEQRNSLPRRNETETQSSAQSFWSQTSSAWRKWKNSTLRTNDDRNAPKVLEVQLCNSYWKNKRQWLSGCLQSGFCFILQKMGFGNRRKFAHIAKTLGCEERFIAGLVRVVNISCVERSGVQLVYNLQVNGANSYSTSGILVHNCTAFKHHTSQRSKALAKLAFNFKYRSLMSGTPTSNGILDIWHQMFILDGGQRLGKSYFGFRNAACYPEQVGPSSQMVKWHDKPGVNLVVSDMLKDVSIRHAFEDCVDIPENYRYAVSYKPSKKHQAQYDDMQDYHFLQLAKTGVTAINGAVVYTKLLQIASGAVYNDAGEYSLVDTGRYEMIMDLVEAREHSIVFFNWEHQRDELVKEAKVRKFSYAIFDGSTSDKLRSEIVREYQKGNYKVLFAHPASAGHGLTLTRGTATIWASPTYNLEHFLQGLKRIHRIGQTEKTETIVVIAEGTIDEKVWLVLKDKDAKQGDLLGLLKEEVK